MSLCHKLWNYIFGAQCRKSLIFQTYIIWSNRIHSLKYLRSTTLKSKDIGLEKQSLSQRLNSFCIEVLSKNSRYKSVRWLNVWLKLLDLCFSLMKLSLNFIFLMELLRKIKIFLKKLNLWNVLWVLCLTKNRIEYVLRSSPITPIPIVSTPSTKY